MSSFDADYLAAISRAQAAGLQPANPLVQTLAEARAAADRYQGFWSEGLPPVPCRVREFPVEDPRGPLVLRLFFPASPAGAETAATAGTGPALPVVLYCHGGGYVLNSLDTHDRVMRLLAQTAGVAVCGLGYTRAPELRFPGQLGQALAALDWLACEGPRLGLAPDRLAIAGDSAGANLALATVLAARDRGGPAISAAALFYGMFLADFDTESHRAFGGGVFGLTTERYA